MSLYMHTINGQPGEYGRTGYIVYSGRCVGRLATSLAQIKKEQAAVRAKDKADGAAGQFLYGYVRISDRALSATPNQKGE